MTTVSSSSRFSNVSRSSTTTLYTTKLSPKCISSMFYVKVEGCPRMVCFRAVDLVSRNITATDLSYETFYRRSSGNPSLTLVENESCG
jgi:hypothetical protein